MSSDPLDYHDLLQDALRGLVRRSLQIVAEQGPPGDHHFYLVFRTDAPGVELAAHLRDRYPEEMTIVLKTQFQDLVVEDEAFSVGLFFSGVLNHLRIPFAALTSFTDPAANFQLAFQPMLPDEPEAASTDEAGEEARADGESGDNVVSFAGFRKKK